MPAVPIPVSQFDDGALPLTGAELLPLVQNGHTVKVSTSALTALAGNVTRFGNETSFVAVAGDNNNAALGSFNRVLVDTAAGDAVITGMAAPVDVTLDGLVRILVNNGVNMLTIAAESVLSTAANRQFGLADITLPSHGTMLLFYSFTLARWVMVS